MLDKLKNEIEKLKNNEIVSNVIDKIKTFELNKETLLYILLGTKGLIEIFITFMILFRVQVGIFIKNTGLWFTGGNIFIGFVNLIIFMCICIILGQFLLKEVEEYLESKVNLSTVIDLSLLTVGFVGAIINVMAHKHMFITAITKATSVSVGAAVFFTILNAIIVIAYKKISERLA